MPKECSNKKKWYEFDFGLYLFILCLTAMIQLAFVLSALGQSIIRDVRDADNVESKLLVLPYAFYSPSYDLAIGVGAGIAGYPQEQARLFGTILGTTNATVVMVLGASDIQLPLLDRFFMDFMFQVGRYTEYRAYVNGNPVFPVQNAGANDSSKDNYFSGDSTYLRTDFKIRYLLPIGHGREHIIHTYTVDRGILVAGATGGENWNPLAGGRSYIEVVPFYRHRDLKMPTGNETFNTNGLQGSVLYDNTDFTDNPSVGSITRLSVSRDFGLLDSSDTWTVAQGEFSKFFSLGDTPTFRQRVIGLNVWTADSLSWQESDSSTGNAPPYYSGATLGGFNRLRAYPESRFHDRSAIYYSAEYRVIPYWNPLGEIGLLKPLEIDWMQLVGFVELGRVAPSWNLSELHSNMKWDAGLGIRALMRKFVGRIDFAVSEEGGSVWAMVGQPF
jgi:hypothetical protein